MDELRTAYKKIKPIFKYIALFSNLIIVCTSFLLLVLLKYKDVSLILFFFNILACGLMWFFLVYMKLAHDVYHHNNRKREESLRIIIWITVTQCGLIVMQVLLCIKN